ncbi:MAG: DeoR/GlpR transcriptional regulator [Firmicutes bacterium]|nr:DeoR/GlpR transcriptional regulator [Bacillota bacterium]
MLAFERTQAILRILRDNKMASVRELAEEFGVSVVTIRRDLERLENDGLVLKKHGGAVLLDHNMETGLQLSEREQLYRREKKLIGEAAARLVKPGTSVILDEGSTCLEVARALRNATDITVITNGLRVGAELLGTGVNLILVGGVTDHQSAMLYGPETERVYKSLRADIYFMGLDAFSEVDGIMDASVLQVSLKNVKVNAVQRVIGVANGAKYGKRAMSLIGPLSLLDALVTEGPVDAELRECLARHRIECIEA